MKNHLFIHGLSVAFSMLIKEATAQTKESNSNFKNKYKIENPVGVPDTTPFRFQPDNSKGHTQIAYNLGGIDNFPSFPGGEDVFTSSYLNKNIHVGTKTKGRVIISFIVQKNGSLTNFTVLRGVNSQADQEVIKVLRKSPKWIPGKKGGKVVNVQYVMPLNINQ